MPPKSWVWDEFEKGNDRYKTNQSHWNAYCKACIQARIRQLRVADLEAAEEGLITSQRDEKALYAAGGCHFTYMEGAGPKTKETSCCPRYLPGPPTAKKDTTPRCGKAEDLITYLAKTCPNVSKEIKTRAEDARRARLGNQSVVHNQPSQHGPTAPEARNATGSSGEDHLAKRPKQAGFSITSTPRWTKARQDEFASDLCRLLVACGWSWNSIENPEFTRFSTKWIAGAEPPDRRTLSSTVLDAEVKKCEKLIKGHVKGSYATGQSDGWKNVSKTSLLATMISAKGEVCSYPINANVASALTNTL